MAVCVNVLLRDPPDELFAWVKLNVSDTDLVRCNSRGVGYDMMARGAVISTVPEDDPRLGWLTKIVVTNQETADRIAAEWRERGAIVRLSFHPPRRSENPPKR